MLFIDSRAQPAENKTPTKAAVRLHTKGAVRLGHFYAVVHFHVAIMYVMKYQTHKLYRWTLH